MELHLLPQAGHSCLQLFLPEANPPSPIPLSDSHSGAGSSHPQLPRACRDALELILPALLWQQAACRSIWRALPADAPLKTSPRPAGMPGIRLIPSPAGVTHPLCPGSWGLFTLSEQPWSAPAALPGPAALPASGCAHGAELHHTRSTGTSSVTSTSVFVAASPVPQQKLLSRAVSIDRKSVV